MECLEKLSGSDEAQAESRIVLIVVTYNGVCLATARMAVCEETAAPAPQNIGNSKRYNGVVYPEIIVFWAEDGVKCLRSLSMGDLPPTFGNL